MVRTAGSFDTVSVSWVVIHDDSSVGDVSLDLKPVSGTVTFAENEREKLILLTVMTDSLPEPAERFRLSLLPETATGGSKVEGVTYGIVIIEDSDNIYGEVQFDVDEKQKLVIVSIILVTWKQGLTKLLAHGATSKENGWFCLLAVNNVYGFVKSSRCKITW